MTKLCYLKRSSNKLTVTVKVWLLQQNADSNFSQNIVIKIIFDYNVIIRKCMIIGKRWPQKLRMFKSIKYTMVIIFIDRRGTIYREFLRQRFTVPAFYKDVICGFCSEFNVSDHSFWRIKTKIFCMTMHLFTNLLLSKTSLIKKKERKKKGQFLNRFIPYSPDKRYLLRKSHWSYCCFIPQLLITTYFTQTSLISKLINLLYMDKEYFTIKQASKVHITCIIHENVWTSEFLRWTSCTSHFLYHLQSILAQPESRFYPLSSLSHCISDSERPEKLSWSPFHLA